MADHLTMAGIGVIVCILALVLPSRFSGEAGFAYLLIGITKTFFGFYTGRKLRASSHV